MYEKVNPQHPDKVADRMAGAIVDYAYAKYYSSDAVGGEPRIAVEGTVGHGLCSFIIETTVPITSEEVESVLERFVSKDAFKFNILIVPQDPILSKNQEGCLRCGDNGIFKSMPVTEEESKLTKIAKDIYDIFGSDGKYIINGNDLIICQSSKYGAASELIQKRYPTAVVNPLGEWTGGLDVDSGAVNRKLGSDMGESVTGGGLHGKDLTKADVSVNIYAFLKAQILHEPVEICCAIGDTIVDGKQYKDIVEIARQYIKIVGGFEKFAEWGLIR